MAETLELQQVICPSCKQVITSFNPFQATVECPYCHNKAFNPLITGKKVPVPERIIPFQTTEKDFERNLVKELAERDFIPDNIFSHIGTGNVFKAYLPMYLFEGTFQASWTCNISVRANEVSASVDGKRLENRTVSRQMPHSGNTTGNFSFLCLAYEGDDVPAELKEFAKQYEYDPITSKEYDPALIADGGEGNSPLTFGLNGDPDAIFEEVGTEQVRKAAIRDTMEQLSGQSYNDLNASVSYELGNSGRYVLAPFWFVCYTYSNEKYYCIMDGLGQRMSLSAPQDITAMSRAEQIDKKKLVTAFALFFYPGSIAYIFFDAPMAMLVLMILAAAIIFGVTNPMYNQQKKLLFEASRAKRANAAKAMGMAE